MTTVTVYLEVKVDDVAWARAYGAGDAYDRAEAQTSRSLVADVEDYIRCQLTESAAAQAGGIVSVDLIPGGEYA